MRHNTTVSELTPGMVFAAQGATWFIVSVVPITDDAARIGYIILTKNEQAYRSLSDARASIFFSRAYVRLL